MKPVQMNSTFLHSPDETAARPTNDNRVLETNNNKFWSQAQSSLEKLI